MVSAGPRHHREGALTVAVTEGYDGSTSEPSCDSTGAQRLDRGQKLTWVPPNVTAGNQHWWKGRDV